MEPTSDRRFDQNFAVHLLLEIAHEQSLEPLLKKIVERAVERAKFVFSQVWTIKKGRLCATRQSANAASRRFGSKESRFAGFLSMRRHRPGEGLRL